MMAVLMDEGRCATAMAQRLHRFQPCGHHGLKPLQVRIRHAVLTEPAHQRRKAGGRGIARSYGASHGACSVDASNPSRVQRVHRPGQKRQRHDGLRKSRYTLPRWERTRHCRPRLALAAAIRVGAI